MNPQTTNTTTALANGGSTASELFALTDEQILEIDPEPQDVQVRGSEAEEKSAVGSDTPQAGAVAESSTPAGAASPAINPAAATPDAAAQATAPTPFSAPEDVRALAELYPGGITQAKTAAERASTLDEIDAAYFGAAGHSPEQTNAARAQLAQRMLNENPAAFREMVFAGLRALEAAGNTPVGATLESPSVNADAAGGASPAHTASIQHGHATGVSQPARAELEQQAQLAAYGAFEKVANADLERSVGSAIERALHHALPHNERAESAVLGARLSATIRTDIEKALQGDRQLSEQVTQILSARRFDNETRAQIVRLINDRAQQLVPGAAKRALNDWTQATLAAHRSRTRSAGTGASRADVTPASGQGIAPGAVAAPREEKSGGASSRVGQNTNTYRSSRVDYRKLSDEQILDL